MCINEISFSERCNTLQIAYLRSQEYQPIGEMLKTTLWETIKAATIATLRPFLLIKRIFGFGNCCFSKNKIIDRGILCGSTFFRTIFIPLDLGLKISFLVVKPIPWLGQIAAYGDTTLEIINLELDYMEAVHDEKSRLEIETLGEEATVSFRPVGLIDEEIPILQRAYRKIGFRLPGWLDISPIIPPPMEIEGGE